jgi:signal peptidase I
MENTVEAEGLALKNSISLENTNLRPASPLPPDKKNKKPFSLIKLLVQCGLVAVLAYGSYALLTHYVLQSVEVVGNSMSPTLRNSEHYFLNRWAYVLRDPQRSDVVVLRDPTDKSFSVKRIIASEGDSVYIKDGKVFVNGRLLKEPYLPEGTETFASPLQKEQWLLCGKGQYIVLGDNRNNSLDSRIYGSIPRQDILGVIVH